jgi:ammonia channel protein AmtB
MACAIFPNEGWSWSTSGFTSIYGTPLTLSALTFNILMGFAGGIIGAWMVSRDPFWMMSGALGGIISCAAGLDLWWPPLAFAVGFIGGAIMPSIARFVERMGIDDAVGAFTVHGALGVWGVLAVGIFAAGYPAIPGEGVAMTNFMGQLIGAVVMVLCGLVPGYVLSLIMKSMGVLRVPESAEVAGLDITKVPSKAYPEGMSGGSTAPAE